MYHQKVLLCLAAITTVFESVVCTEGNCTFIDCLSTLNQSACAANGQFLEIDTAISCCPRCRRGVDLGVKDCNETTSCSPGLQCLNGTCVLDKSTCSYTYHLQHLQQLPQCENDGTFTAKQCRGDKVLGRCFCYSDDGKRIFGWDWHSNSDSMTCACSRHRYQLESEGKISTLHCTSNGNYEPLQCDSGICWCAEEKTGRIVDGTRAVPQALWTRLPCYNSTELGTEYLRQCESIAYAQNVLREKLSKHGTVSVSIVKTQCDFDGSYGTYSISNNIASCMWRDGTRIGAYATNANQVSKMNCNCARDHLHFEAMSMQMPLVCDGYGNYESIQTLNGDLFCVDRDGFSVTHYLSDMPSCSDHLYYEYI
ncbi:hypothetical protein HA402_002616 [Bradysia odoriphaga]|nr:hypothetical protein HA402_002616 [Bradysia odoriphaga]